MSYSWYQLCFSTNYRNLLYLITDDDMNIHENLAILLSSFFYSLFLCAKQIVIHPALIFLVNVLIEKI